MNVGLRRQEVLHLMLICCLK